MGSIVENWTYEKIEKTYGKIEMPLMLNRIETEDDNRIMLLYCEAYLKYKRNITPEDLAKIWIEKFDPGDDFFWCMRNSLELLKRGVSPRQTGIYNINTGSVLMAIAPVGIYNILEPSRAFSDALDLAFMYQPKPDAYCAAAFATGVAESFNPNATPKSIAKIIRKYSLDEKIIYWDERNLNNIATSIDIAFDIAEKYENDWWSARKEIYDKLTQWHPIDPMEVLSISICLFLMTNGKYEEGVIARTNIGRDADTISNLIGTLAGALQGIFSIPEDWREGVKEINENLYNKFEKIAENFTDLLEEKIKNYKKITKILPFED